MIVSYDYLPQCEPVPGSAKLVRLCKDWYLTIDGKQWWVPNGYSLDMASIPRIFWSIIGNPYTPTYWAAATGHDYFYLTHLVTRSEADEVLYQLLLKSGVSSFKAHIIWGAVRSFAWAAWTNSSDDLAVLQALKREVAERLEHDGWKFGLGTKNIES